MRLGIDQANADKFGAEVTLPDCLSVMLSQQVLPKARQDWHAREITEKTLPLPEVQSVLNARERDLSILYEMVSEGKPFLELGQWLTLLKEKLILTDVTVCGYSVRLTEPQARWAFLASARTPASGLLPPEFAGCVARCGFEKFKQVDPMRPGARAAAFVAQLLDDDDEERLVADGIVPALEKKQRSIVETTTTTTTADSTPNSARPSSARGGTSPSAMGSARGASARGGSPMASRPTR